MTIKERAIKKEASTCVMPPPSDGSDRSALGGETRASGDGPPAAELRGRCKHPGQPGNHGADVRL